MKLKLGITALIAVAALAVAAVALASGGVTIEQGNPWDNFPAASSPGDVVSVTVCTFQSGDEGSHATVTFGGLKAAGLTFLSNGDHSATTSGNQNKVVVSYTDYAHSVKCDSYTFQVAADQPYGSYAIHVAVVVEDVGQKGETLTLNLPAPTPSASEPITQVVFVQVVRIAACASQPVARADGTMGTFIDLDEDTFNAATFEGVTFTTAIYEQGVGLTCDTPSSFHDANVKVNSAGVTQPDGGNLYELYVR